MNWPGDLMVYSSTAAATISFVMKKTKIGIFTIQRWKVKSC